jgi:ATP-dependent RNA helicase MRH4, mitochondrial
MISATLKTSKNILVGSQTGTGKTLGYLLPLFHALKIQETTAEKPLIDYQMIESSSATSKYNSNSPLITARKLKRPRGIILVPSRQLVGQVTNIAKELSYECKMRVVGIHSKTKHLNDLLSAPSKI